jgi:hypothetical protein
MTHRTAAWALILALLLPASALAGPKFTASSARVTDKESFAPEMAFDGLLNTSWGEDAPGVGIDHWLEVDLGEETEIGTLSIWGGAFSGHEYWNARGRVAELAIVGTNDDGKAVVEKTVELGDRYARKDTTIDATVRKLRFTLVEVHEGAVFADTHIAEVAFDFKKKPDPAWMDEINTKIDKDRKLQEKPSEAREALESAYAACKIEEDYSRNFKTIAWYAVHGPEYMVELVNKYVPVGHRLKVLQFNEDALEMLGKLRDANAIQYLEIAAAGARKSSDREWLMESVAYFEAYQDLIRTPRASIPNWGVEGMEKGAFQSRGEPLSISVDSAGNVWVADVGNNRVQRLTPAGTADLVIGGDEKKIVESWFGDTTAPYASGSEAGTTTSRFSQPLFVSVGNYDYVMVIDAEMRVQVFDSEKGELKTHWQLETHWRPSAGTGNGTPIITWLEDDFYIIVKDEVFIYTPEGELKARYNLEGGNVQSAVIAAGGKLLVRHVGTREIVEYKPEDGFRQGAWLRKPVEDDGSEDWDMATDEKDNVYVVTDAGNVFKWNKKAKFIEKIQVFENPRDMPRIAVFDTIIYISAKNQISRTVQEQ